MTVQSILKFCIGIIICTMPFGLFAQDHKISHEEIQLMPQYLNIARNRITSSPPISPVRTMAEWEPVSALIISWTNQTAIQREIVRHAAKECKVYILTNNAASVTNVLEQANISLDSVFFVDTPFNSIWVRDYGPWSVYDQDVDSLRIIDWIYNRPRPADDGVPGRLAELLGLPFHEAISPPNDWVHTGGNHLTDGLGTAFSSLLVMDENPAKSESEIDSIANRFLGVSRYIKFPTLPYDEIHHLDMHMCLLDEETILFGQYPEGIADGPQIEENIQYLLENFPAPSGNPYRIIRVQMPPDGSGRYPNQNGNYRTYTNSIFINKTILVPIYEERFDSTALRIYRENLPGYNVVGINCNNIIGQLGALHCITKTVGKHEPIWIAHSRLRDQEDTVLTYPIAVIADHVSGISNVELYYREVGDEAFGKISLQFEQGQTWTGSIPGFEAGTDVEYYFEAYALNGQSQTRPITGSDGGFRFSVRGDVSENLPPTIKLLSPDQDEVFHIEDIVEINYEATDSDGTIDSVFLLVNSEVVNANEGSLQSFEWSSDIAGVYSISLRARDEEGLTNDSEVVEITVEDVSAVNWAENGSVCVFPNPTYDQLRIQTNDQSSILIEDVMDVYGKTVQRFDGARQFEVVLDVSGLTPGIYILKGQLNGSPGYFRFVKQ